MSYEKQTWVNGEVITADKLNHMENGIADGGGGSGSDNFIVTINPGDSITADKTFDEVKQAWLSGSVILFKMPSMPNSEPGSYAIANPQFQSDFTNPVRFFATYVSNVNPTSMAGYEVDYRPNEISINNFNIS